MIVFQLQYSLIWFIYVFIGIYLILPIVSHWLNKVSQKRNFYLFDYLVFKYEQYHIYEYLGLKKIEFTKGKVYYMSNLLWCAICGHSCKNMIK